MFNDLIFNVRDAMANGGRIAIYVHGIGVKLTITGTRQGIPEDRIAKVFQPFFTSKRSGLGLSLVRRIVEKHHGEILLSSQESQQTTETLRFPAGQ